MGERTASFLIEEVKPWAERSFRVSADRRRVAVAGSSLGGYMSLYTAARFSDQVSAALAFSPVALDRPMAGHVLRAYLAATPPVSRSATTSTWAMPRTSTTPRGKRWWPTSNR